MIILHNIRITSSKYRLGDQIRGTRKRYRKEVKRGDWEVKEEVTCVRYDIRN